MKNKTSHLGFKMIRITNLYDITVEQVYAYVRNLHRHIRKQNMKILKLRRKLANLKKLKRSQPKETESLPVDDGENPDKSSDDVMKALEKAEMQQKQAAERGEEPLDVKAFVDDIKKTAHDFDFQNRYVYEPTSGLYYDQDTGYYYNAIYGLHYDGNRGCYLKYNEATQEYDFYSQVIPEKTLEEQQPKARQKKSKRADVEPDSADEGEKDRYNRHTERDRRRRRPPPARRSRSKSRGDSHRKRYPERHRSRSNSCYSISSRSDSEERQYPRKKPQAIDGKRRDRKHSDGSEHKEEGELDSSSGSSNESERKSPVVIVSSDSERDESVVVDLNKYTDISHKYPPSLRIIVQGTNLEALKQGSLFIVTCKGGSLGREGNHDVIIPDINVSKYHLKFAYHERSGLYQVVDLGSRNGTMLNGVRMSPTMQESDPFNVIHGSVIQLNQTKLLCHIHHGNSTCGNCEPGLLVKGIATNDIAGEDERITKPVTHKEGLKLLQKRYGLEDEKYVEPAPGSTPMDYNDRAAHRRKIKGSTNGHEKTKVASLNEHIGSENKGFKMLSKLGWSEGQALGKNEGGITEPIPLATNVGTSGLGSQGLAQPTAHNVDDRKKMIWMMTQERYKACADVVTEKNVTQTASLQQHISTENKGFQLLTKLGWNEGQTLGKNEDGLKEPVRLLSNVGTSGLGSKPLKQPDAEVRPSKKKGIWKKKQKTLKSSDMFENSDSG
ncbi:angiogenic factor with G patch and FHA domains 1 [Toxorhynchites rutilus septentrionalis]|uniref:angiogenic factor with G patch and FHA domains 1 n=1 Tax=Toxorhynchites rutilus septentrionalis TaxID=329112 RepID=UPI002479EE4D|nr:angiogenic factor with G patch and FHA domains 1 [Toxorhynchites rutilus septentrionalis]